MDYEHFISMVYMYIETFHLSVKSPNTTTKKVVCGTLFGGIHTSYTGISHSVLVHISIHIAGVDYYGSLYAIFARLNE